jgi:hypothetical protein
MLSGLKVQTASAGLQRLAFGACNDAVKLAFSDELPPSHMLEKMDLFNVSDIKRVKGGGVEVKLFDRQKALEKLYEIASNNDGDSSALSFIKALQSESDADSS